MINFSYSSKTLISNTKFNTYPNKKSAGTDGLYNSSINYYNNASINSVYSRQFPRRAPMNPVINFLLNPQYFIPIFIPITKIYVDSN